MVSNLGLALLLASGAVAQGAAAQGVPAYALEGTRLDVIATGEVTRVPDIARINAGVVTQAPTATAAIEQNARQMAAVRAALRRAGIADRDIQTSTVNLNPDYRYVENQSPQLVGYRAGNEVTVRFRDIANTGRILDALVAQGANQINGPMLGLDAPEAALDEARTAALRTAQARADLYARALGKRVRRVLSVSEAGIGYQPVPRPMALEARGAAAMAQTKIDPGEQTVSISLTVSYELE
ncbi:MAG TPA: SIMPL domain-containing protein [Allosphingosinicella sp.]|jgi:hypothetical protein|uniref:SIMPL domain-containing protein n=1 Tax=Allosphingosinicella sp. TaxID=2823234 RepID=UPI002F29A03C